MENDFVCCAVINDAYWKSLLYLFGVKLALSLMEHQLEFLEVKMLGRNLSELPRYKKTPVTTLMHSWYREI